MSVTGTARRGGPETAFAAPPDRPPFLPATEHLARPGARRPPPRGDRLPAPLPAVVGAGPVPVATGQPPATARRVVARQQGPGAAQPDARPAAEGPSRPPHARLPPRP